MLLHFHVARRLRIHKVSKDDRLKLHNLVEGPLEVLVHLALAKIVEPHVILLHCKAILEDTLTLMQPNSAQVVDLGKRLSRTLANALEHFGDISHVEGVMRLRRSGQQLLQHGGVNLKGRRHGSTSHRHHISGHDRQELVDNSREDSPQAFFIERNDKDQIVPARVAVRDVVLATARWTHRSQEVQINELSELPAFAIVPAISMG
mmetsp:Transcript_24736/g.57478  ORF Transcript_24736/g.57478 Transcript_24736/m.57478 type:complete len:205 (+) Transcript_24736:2140-2754(+)